MKVALLLTFDSLSLRFLGCYGRWGDLTPSFDRCAAESVVFDAHFAENVDSEAENHAWNCGTCQFPLEYDAQRKQRDVLRSALHDGGVTVREFVENSAGSGSFANLVNEAVECLQQTGAESDDGLLIWLKAAVGDVATAVDDTNIEYASRIGLIDAEFGRLWDACREFTHSKAHELTVIVTAAEGADLGEQPHLPEPIRRLGEAVVHTPLLVFATDGEAGTRRGALVQTIDIVPTLCEWFDLPVEVAAFDGQSLLPLVRGESEEFTSPAREYLYLGDGRRAVGIRSRHDYLIAEPLSDDESRVQLYVKPEDIWEVHDVAAQNPHVVDELRPKLDEFLSRNGMTKGSDNE